MDNNDRNGFIEYYFQLGMSQKDIVVALAVNHDILLSERHLRRILQSLNLYRRRNYTDLGNVVLFIQRTLNTSGMLHGYRWMYHKCQSNGLHVRKEDVRLILASLDPVGSAFRRARRLHRRNYFAVGPNFIWHLDGYDKIKPFGFCISGCVDGFSRKVIWLNVYHTNSDPKLIGGYFIEAIEELRGCPTLIRGDPGTENVLVKQVQTFLMRNGRNGQNKAYIEGTSTANQRIESFWAHVRRQCIEFWICLFHDLQNHGNYSGDFVDKQLLLFCFLAQIQVSRYRLHLGRDWGAFNIVRGLQITGA